MGKFVEAFDVYAKAAIKHSHLAEHCRLEVTVRSSMFGDTGGRGDGLHSL